MTTETSSFRDPAGFLFYHDGVLYRQVNHAGADDFEHLMRSGLYETLTKAGQLVPHQRAPETAVSPRPEICHTLIKPAVIPFISYPYEWCFSQYKNAALLTLNITQEALKHGMILKDASAYNVQFFKGKAVFIDTLSFTRYEEGKPWNAYKQFCQHFLAPLALMAKKDLRLSSLMKNFLDGIDLDLASSLLPAFIPIGLQTNIRLHALAQQKYRHQATRQSTRGISKHHLEIFLQSLTEVVMNLKMPVTQTQWGKYYTFTNYSDKAFSLKKEIVESFIQQTNPSYVWDLGANNGEMTRLATKHNIFSVAFDIDPIAVEANFQRATQNGDGHMLPLLLDLTNPSPALGWHHRERQALLQRPKPDLVMALALIHHLCISNNVPLSKTAAFFADIAPFMIIEFVPKEDSQVQKLLASREDVFGDYNQENFERAYTRFFDIVEKNPVSDSHRTLYLMKRHSKQEA